jgi:S1-C subfamily serine protease
VVGINTYILSDSGTSEGVGFAIPSEIASPVYEQLRRYKRLRRGRMGLVGETITPQMADMLGLPRDSGVIVSDVDPDGPADHAGIQKEDMIVALNGRPVERLRQLELSSYQHLPGETVKLGVQRGSQQFDTDICLNEDPPGLANLADMLDASDNFISEIGIVGLSVSISVQKWLPNLRRPQGVLVVAANSEGDYSARGLERGDVIYEINRHVVAKVAELRYALRQAKEAGNAVLLVERSGHLVYVAVEVN